MRRVFNYLLFASLLFNCFIFNVYASDGCSLLSTSQVEILQEIFTIIRIVVPCLVVVLVVKDFAQAVMAQKDDEIKKAQTTAIKRLVIGIIIFLIPTVVNVVLNLIGNNLSTCGIG